MRGFAQDERKQREEEEEEEEDEEDVIQLHRSDANGQQQHHVIHLNDVETRPPSLSVTSAPLLIEKWTKSVVSASQTLVTDSVAEAMSLLPKALASTGLRRKDSMDTYSVEPRVFEVKDTQTRLRLHAFWQLLLTGFEVVKYSIGKRSKTQILWLGLDGKLSLENTKQDWNTSKAIFLADVYKVQKGSSAQSFTKSQSWRDARNKDALSFSIHGKTAKKEERTFAVQVLQTGVRNVLTECFDALLRMIKSDSDGEFPFVAQKVIAQQYAATGDVITLRQVEDILLREEDEIKGLSSGGGSASSIFISEKRTRKLSKEDGDSSSDDSDQMDDESQRNILG